jgi:hypothetical protein
MKGLFLFIFIFLVIFLASAFACQAQAAPCVPSGSEVPGNPADEDCDGWLGTAYPFSIRATHPRVFATQEIIDAAISRMYGAQAQDPYKRWFNITKKSEDTGTKVDLTSLALLYTATQNTTYKDRLISRMDASTGTPSLEEMYAMDLLFDEIPDSTKLSLMRRVNADPNIFMYNLAAQSRNNPANVRWGYHNLMGPTAGIAYSGLFAYTDIMQSSEVINNPALYGNFNVTNFINVTSKELSPEGNLFKIENRIAGDPTYNNALPGSPGGMYDNFGYDSSEEGYSMGVLFEFYMLTGQDRFSAMRHDKYRATYYQNMEYPMIFTNYASNAWCRRAGTESHRMARIWSTQTDWTSQPNALWTDVAAFVYDDPKMQHFVINGVQNELCGAPYTGIYMDMVYRNESMSVSPLIDNPTAMYFSGPGLVSMRSDWTNDAAFAVFDAGERISRRYEDTNSFLLSRKTEEFVHAGARIRYQADNDKHHWYAIRSAAKNTMKIYDPDESWDVAANGTIMPLHTGPKLVASDNLGGQIFETPVSGVNGCYDTGMSAACNGTFNYAQNIYPLGVPEKANIIKFEHFPDDYTYSVGDGTASYTRKIDFFEREFLYMRPDIFVIYDRVKKANESFRSVWTLHSADEPVVSKAAAETGLGMKRFYDASQTAVESPKNVAYIDTVFPKSNKMTVRGGDSILIAGYPIAPGKDIPGSAVTELDMPRWLEVFAVGIDTLGNLTIRGDALEGNGTSENVNFDGRSQTYVSDVPTSMNTTQMRDAKQNWKTDQWKGYFVHLHLGGSAPYAVVTGNNQNTLFGTFPAGSAWQYDIEKSLSNSYFHWKNITGISTQDMDANVTISVPHYFDTEDAYGNVYSFSPHTDYRDDGYVKRPDLGQWTFEVEALGNNKLDNFLNVISMKDPGSARPAVLPIDSSGVSGAVIDDKFVVFAKDRTNLGSFQIALPATGDFTGMFLDLVPSTRYYYNVNGSTVYLATAGSGPSVVSSPMGVLKLFLTVSNLTQIRYTPKIKINLDGIGDRSTSCRLQVISVSNVMVREINFTTNSTGDYIAILDNVPRQVRLRVIVPGFLARTVNNIDLEGAQPIVFPAMMAGDADGNNLVNIADFFSVIGKWYQQDPVADFNGDGIVNALDVSSIGRNWMKSGD